jgi:hypothetical protein
VIAVEGVCGIREVGDMGFVAFVKRKSRMGRKIELLSDELLGVRVHDRAIASPHLDTHGLAAENVHTDSHIERGVCGRRCILVRGERREILDIGGDYRCSSVEEMASSSSRDRKAEDERNDESQDDSDHSKSAEATDLDPVGTKAAYRSSKMPGTGCECHKKNLPRRIRFEALYPLRLANEGDDPIHVLL